MKAFVAVCVVLTICSVKAGVVPATTFVRTPSFDSAIIKSERFGGNFAYSTVEGHAYAAISPVVERLVQPVGVSLTAHQVHLGNIATPVAVSHPIYAQQTIFSQPSVSHEFVSAPVFAQNPTLAQAPVFAQTPALAQAPVLAQAPGVPQAPIFAQNPAFGGIASAPAAEATPAQTPAAGTVVDADTVSIESA